MRIKSKRMSGLGMNMKKTNLDFGDSFNSAKFNFSGARKSEMREEYGSASPIKLHKNNKLR